MNFLDFAVVGFYFAIILWIARWLKPSEDLSNQKDSESFLSDIFVYV